MAHFPCVEGLVELRALLEHAREAEDGRGGPGGDVAIENVAVRKHLLHGDRGGHIPVVQGLVELLAVRKHV